MFFFSTKPRFMALISPTRKYLQLLSALILLLHSLYGCKSLPHKKLHLTIDQALASEGNNNYFQGVFIYDPQKKDTLYQHNSQKYFTPASNTKIFTLFASLKTLPNNIPALKYVVLGDTLYMEGTGDPTLLHHYYNDSTALKFAAGYPNIALHLNNFQETKFGPGWAWDDYDRNYSPERSGLPLYGNTLSVYQTDTIVASPSFFSPKIISQKQATRRALTENLFYVAPNRKDTLEIPFLVDSLVIQNLLEKALHKKLSLVPKMPASEKRTIYSIPSDSLYTRMMYESDNFIAEQLLILASSTLSDTLSSAKARNHVLDTYLKEMPQSPRWVDGSGLSRYNLFSPESIVFVLNKMYQEIPQERLLGYFPIGGISGTLKDSYPGKNSPYIYAKSGSLGNNYCLSGYLLTNSGKTLIFSFMNNHFKKSSKEVKEQMQEIFEWLRDNY
ncbi:D-alanyl-D-alanine carboxypeptidase / D-alanyl-D-alanine-endopeptidase (penicillin-binding protein 4) [Arenibacter nanhaiticus]|uniref:D-alanyl-D-alanine carboxypeptidase / D-alanyl-D-alanine-endopeptidase (Penicillin-binding protein 4) n=2 Tax=Arenibacter nanhaiticus TaxID=558155 RepID=A0A1M6E6J1_9FLAO|nr:D-alanyl-D-alanine carboxypeptidase / D-alanyl-D-alanine-endopeptidase (penicillin-binding protein 4) [Arenibacter nanhaiticus]